MTRIASSDLLICDVVLPLAEHPEFEPLIERYNHDHPDQPITVGSKSPLTADEFLRWQAAAGTHGRYVAGGSAANTLSTLKQLMGDALHVDFIAAYGNDQPGQVVAESLKRDHFHLLPQDAPYPDVQTATSFILVDAKGERSIVGYGGTGGQKILSFFSDHTLPDYDVLFLSGSLWQKYGRDFAQKLSASASGKRLWLSLPTHSQSGRLYNEDVRALIPKAEITLANAEELKRLYNCELPEALRALQRTLNTGFITDGSRGAYVVTKESVRHIAPELVPAQEVKNTLGAGDAAFAGFLFGSLRQWEAPRAAEFAMKLAALNLRHDSARFPGLVIS